VAAAGFARRRPFMPDSISPARARPPGRRRGVAHPSQPRPS